MKFVMNLVATAAIGVFATIGAAQAQEKVVLRASDIHPDGYPTVEAVKHMGEILAKETNGRLSIAVFPEGQLGEEKDSIQQAQKGMIDITRVNGAAFNNLIPETRVPGLPFLFRSIDHMHKVLDGAEGAEILKAFEAKEMVGLCFYDSGARSFYNNVKPIRTLADVKGLRIRVQQSDLMIDTMKALGADPMPIPMGEIYGALQAGMIDGAENNWPTYQSQRHYEQAKYYSLTQHSMMPEVLVMSKKSWDKLSADDQAAVLKAAKESVPYMRKLWEDREKAAEKEVLAAGSEVNDVDKDAFMKAVEPVYEKYVTDANLKSLVEKIRAVK